MRPSRAIDDTAHRAALGLTARRMNGPAVAGRLMAAHGERMLAQAGARLTRWLEEQDGAGAQPEAPHESPLAADARAVVQAMARWRRWAMVADARAALAAVAGLEAAVAGALPGFWRAGDLWWLAQAAEALNGEDRLWLCP